MIRVQALLVALAILGGYAAALVVCTLFWLGVFYAVAGFVGAA